MKFIKKSLKQLQGCDLFTITIEFLRGFIIILLFLVFGKLISAYLPIPFPASIIGLILLFSALSTSLVKVEWVMMSGHFILKYMALLFIPIGVGLLNYFDLIISHWSVIVFSLLFTTLFIMLLVGHFYQHMNKHKES
ncbi:CidA/LrgA family protein [Psychromonas antarctica]|jgi:holin-like protein|uniref:CidA/LrgA family protein n=1 Tax=Psychromonas antarctica TaxID=67573 RepID=UPI001EE808FF|nr:CidA/LrgA family protein [Psychromonas antarctica]MCG6199930.1 CidA/LrgA family protein [Psychromonas antarctica]